MLGAISVDEFKCHDTYWTTTEMSFIAHLLLDTNPEESVKLAKYLLNNCNEKDNPDLNPDVWQLIHYGIDLYYIVDQPERLKKPRMPYFRPATNPMAWASPMEQVKKTE